MRSAAGACRPFSSSAFTPCLVALLPGFVLVWASFFGYSPPSFDILSTISFAGYTDLFNNPKFWLAARNTFIVAGGSAVIVTTIGVILAWTILRTN